MPLKHYFFYGINSWNSFDDVANCIKEQLWEARSNSTTAIHTSKQDYMLSLMRQRQLLPCCSIAWQCTQVCSSTPLTAVSRHCANGNDACTAIMPEICQAHISGFRWGQAHDSTRPAAYIRAYNMKHSLKCQYLFAYDILCNLNGYSHPYD